MGGRYFALCIASIGFMAGGDLKSPYKKWLQQDAVYIITPEEREAFHGLRTDWEREQFVEHFWMVRNPDPGNEENEFQSEHYRRIAYANEHFASGLPGWRTDRGQIYIRFGPPDEIEAKPAERLERWRYRNIAGLGDGIVIEFVNPETTGDYRMTNAESGQGRRDQAPGFMFSPVSPPVPWTGPPRGNMSTCPLACLPTRPLWCWLDAPYQRGLKLSSRRVCAGD